MPNTLSGGVRRLIFTNKANSIHSIGNFIPGSSVGALNPSVRRAQIRRASIRYDPITKRSHNPCCSSKITYF